MGKETFHIPEQATDLLQRLNHAGYEAYLVGGCVRDLLRGTEPHDWDICTSALPDQVEACFQDCPILATGRKHGTLTLMRSNIPFEVTTYRTEGTYTDGRRPDSVQFVSNLKEDLSRRDFTINAIVMDAAGGIQDPFLGEADLRAGVIRCVGEPDHRFCEDGLRIMRGLRFASVFGFSLEPHTAESIHRNKAMLSHVAAERIHVELCKLLTGDGVEAILRHYVDVLCTFWPELGTMVGMEQHNPWHCFDVWEHTVTAVACSPKDLILRLTMLLHDIGKPPCFFLDEHGVGHFYGHPALSAERANNMLSRLKFDNDTRKHVVELVANHDATLAPRTKLILRWLNKLGEDRFLQLLEVQRADSLALRTEVIPDRLAQLHEIKQKTDEILAEKHCFTLRDLAVNGRDVMETGVAPGPAVGLLLNALLDKVLDGVLPNDRDTLLAELTR